MVNPKQQTPGRNVRTFLLTEQKHTNSAKFRKSPWTRRLSKRTVKVIGGTKWHATKPTINYTGVIFKGCLRIVMKSNAVTRPERT